MSASADPAKAPAPSEEKPEAGSGGELLYCGATNFEAMNRKLAGGMQGNLVSPTRLRSLLGVDIRSVATGCGERSFLPPSLLRVCGVMVEGWELPPARRNV
jgi:hypothetical protein